MEASKFHIPKLANPTHPAPALDAPLALDSNNTEPPLKEASLVSSQSSTGASSQATGSAQIKPPKLHHGRRLWPVLAVAFLVMFLVGISAYSLLGRNRAAKPIALNLSSSPLAPPQNAQPVPTQPAPSTVVPPPTPTPTPTVVTDPRPPASPAGSIRTAIVKSPNGLWLRRSPDSSSQSNVVSWIPNGGRITVDQTADIWWHGTYSGAVGYFNSRYVQ